MVKVKVPATTANFGPGFDCMGAALSLHNYVEMDFSPTIQISVSGEGKDEIDKGEGNLIYKAAQRVLTELEIRQSLRIHQENHIPLARGLGSSAACVAAGMMAAHRLTGEKLSIKRIVELATQMEGHPDNVVPALLGGFCICLSHGEEVLYRRFPLFEDLKFVVGIPEFHLNTQDARKILPKTVDFNDAVFNVGCAAFLAAAVVTGDPRDLGIITQDRLHQPYRSSLVPGLDKILQTATQKGALATFLSGAGPSVLCIAHPKDADTVGKHMVKVFEDCGIISTYKVLSPCSQGVEFM